MYSNVRNIYCVGRNYGLHAAELGNDVPTQPMFFMKPTHSLVTMDKGRIQLPAGQGEIHYEAELVVRVARPYEKGMTVNEMLDGFALGIDFTLRDVQSMLKKKGHPWLAAKGFIGSARITAFQPFQGLDEVQNTPFSLRINGNEVQRGMLRDTIFSLQEIIDFCGTHYGLDDGDILYTGTPAGVGAVRDGDRLELCWNGQPIGAGTIQIL